ncbi:MAG: galactokinase [Chitinophagaceae bacterium]
MNNTNIIEAVDKKFNQLFNQKPLLVRSPGRVNIIGEHTDYNEGFVLPAAIDKAIYIAIGKRDDNTISLYTNEFAEEHQSSLNNLEPSEQHWTNYVLGVADQLQSRGYKIGGFNLVFDGDIPIGAGMSSSAAVECATAFGLNEIFNLNIPTIELVEISQKAEHSFAGVLCGIMDQFASMFGKRDNLIKLDCRSLAYEYVPLKLDGIKILLLNTNVKHSLASSEYNTRRLQCTEGVAMIKDFFPDVNSLRDVTMPMLDQYVKPKDDIIYKRCKYVLEENKRLLQAAEDLKKGQIESLGKRMFLSHEGLKNEYEVSCAELDFLVDFVSNEDAVLGARMMGGGFGGCTINLVKEEAIDDLVERAGKVYAEKMNKELTAYVSQIGDGTSLIY